MTNRTESKKAGDFDVTDPAATIAAIERLRASPHDGWLTVQCACCATIDWFIIKHGDTLHICRNVSEHDDAESAYGGLTDARAEHERAVRDHRERDPEPGPDSVH